MSFWAGTMVTCLGLTSASAQLVITEVMSFAATSANSVPVSQQSDWWELTNFGTNEVNLTGYYFFDNADRNRQYSCFQGLKIQPNESVVFFRLRETPDEAEFRRWWGERLSNNVRIIPYLEIGFNNTPPGDELHLFDPEGNEIDQVSFGEARIGTTFVSDPVTGEFGVFSTLGEYGTFKAGTADDIGSPGTAYGPLPLSILEHPTNLTVCGASDPVLCVRASGLPRPKYEWQFRTDSSGWQPITGENSSCLTIIDVQSKDEGEYRVVLTNGLEGLESQAFRLTVDNTPSPPQLLTNVSNVGNLCELHRFEGEPASFTNVVCAFPRASFQWYSNGEPIDGADSRELEVGAVTLEMSGTVFSVISSNKLGSISASARLLVDPKPTLRITEAMPAPSPSTNAPSTSHANWWELTNLGTNKVELHGFFHSDGNLRAWAQFATNDIVLQPGESLIMLDGLSRDEFIRWWGASNLPPSLQVITYGGYGLSRWSDIIYVWSAAGSLLDSVSYASPTPSPLEPPLCPCYLGEQPNNMCGHPIYGHSLFLLPMRYVDKAARRTRMGRSGQRSARMWALPDSTCCRASTGTRATDPP